MTADDPGRIESAAKRLERAIALLEQRLIHRLSVAGAQAGGLLDQDRAQLATDLDEARGRQRDLEEAGGQASAALGSAIADIRAVLDEARP